MYCCFLGIPEISRLMTENSFYKKNTLGIAASPAHLHIVILLPLQKQRHVH